jgi:hypothetical protein
MVAAYKGQSPAMGPALPLMNKKYLREVRLWTT